MSFLKKKSPSIVPLKDLRPSMTQEIIKVIILKLWTKKSKDGYYTDMILVDDQGVLIHATVEKDVFEKLDKLLLIEGQSVLIEAFKVVKYLGDYRTNTHPFKINFF
ncbi:unnamed protein product [Arabis nemorensis]|uniref:Replication protein A 70 kDa DNA-binding subunit B/D first OB fold domain-containing protein n=1 Tax=Arabis nemorensis TaxID=586526 RepID=A0A565B849_9BRAS|nr:unnamed protein product [Arabis nemorensis]